MPKVQTTRVYSELQQAVSAGYTTVSEQGGSRSGKTVNTIIWLIVYCLSHPGTRLSIVRKTFPSIKGSVFIDFRESLIRMERWNEKALNKNDFIYQFPNGSWVEFFSCDSEQKLRGRKRDILFVNEANELSPLEWQQLKMRTTKFSIIDYNPSITDEHWISSVNKDPRTYHFITTYKDNPFLEQTIIDEIESLRFKNKSLWQVYGLGLQAAIEGLIFTNVELIDEIPEYAKKKHWRGMDFGYSCFASGTLVETINGSKSIETICPGDFVLTRNGYKRVLRRFDNGVKEIIEREITIGSKTVKMAATPEHLFNINGKWKKYVKLTEKDSLYVLSSSTEKPTSATLEESTRTITTTSGRKEASITKNDCTTQSMNTIMGLSQKDASSTTKTEIRSITTSTTSWQSLSRNIAKFTIFCGNICKAILNTVSESVLRKIIGGREGRRFPKNSNHQSGYVTNAGANIGRQMCTKDSARSDVTIDGNIPLLNSMSRENVNGAEKNFKGTNTLSPNAAQKNAPIASLEVSKLREVGRRPCEVFDLEIEGEHEFFANGILVHNCDPTAIVDVFYHDNCLYLDEICYNTEMLASDIIRMLKEHDGTIETISESADPRLIQEIYRGGVNIRPVQKYPGSILAGITKMQEFPKIYITAQSFNGIKEFKNYTWAQDKEGHWLNKPIDAFNHFIDAVRYVCLEKILGGKRKPLNMTTLANIAH